MKIDIYTDGACSGNPGKGGYGIIALDWEGNELFRARDGYRKTTNNRMEILAAARALEIIGEKRTDLLPEGRETDIKVTVFTDSQLVVNTMNQGWSRKANKDLWTRLDSALDALESKDVKVVFVKVKGHSDDRYNAAADELAVHAADNFCDNADETYESIAAKNNTRQYKDEDELAWYVEEEFSFDIQEGYLSEESYRLAKRMVREHYYIPHGPRKHSMELGDEGFRDFLELIRNGADPYDALEQAEENCRQRYEASKEPEIVDINLCGHDTPDKRRIEIRLSNGTTVKVLPCHGGFEQTDCTQAESAVTVDVAWKFVGWLNGRSL